MKLRPPATPILNVDPYFSVWTAESVLKNTMHWTGKPNTIAGRAVIDGKEYHFLGYSERGGAEPMNVVDTHIDAFSTVITYSAGGIMLKVHFTSPLLPNDIYYASRPVVYCKVSYANTDERKHEVKISFTVSEELVLNVKGESRVLSNTVEIPGFTAMKMGNGIQKPLNRSGDDIRIDWGYLYLALKGEAKATNVMLNGFYSVKLEAELKDELLFLFAYDDVESIQYFGDNLKAYWRRDGKTIEEAIVEAAKDYPTLLSRCNEFTENLRSEATKKGSEKYADMLELALRQVMAAHKAVIDTEGNLLYISKECLSNGCAATLDVTYPSSPLYLIYNPELLKGMIRPIFKYAASEEWTFDFAPHDLGTYPLLNGQKYCVDRKPDGTVHINENGQMPVEECGNMIILISAICDADGNTDFATPYMDTLAKWNEYLIKYGEDPEYQNCTDDFAGHLAHNVNLSVKAIMGIAGFARILKKSDDEKGYRKYMAIARKYARSMLVRAKNEDGSFRLTYDNPGTFSLKYNAIWDKIWKTELFPKSFYDGEIKRYKKEQLYYGVPLDSREKYTKSDWLVWAASMASKNSDFVCLTDALWDAFNTMRSYLPMTDWYYCDTSHMRGMYHRSVQGGLFIKLMLG